METNYRSPVGTKVYYSGLTLMALRVIAGLLFFSYLTWTHGWNVPEAELKTFIPKVVGLCVWVLYFIERIIEIYIDKYYNYPLKNVVITRYLAPGTFSHTFIDTTIYVSGFTAVLLSGYSLFASSEFWIFFLRYMTAIIVLLFISRAIGIKMAMKK